MAGPVRSAMLAVVACVATGTLSHARTLTPTGAVPMQGPARPRGPATGTDGWVGGVLVGDREPAALLERHLSSLPPPGERTLQDWLADAEEIGRALGALTDRLSAHRRAGSALAAGLALPAHDRAVQLLAGDLTGRVFAAWAGDRTDAVARFGARVIPSLDQRARSVTVPLLHDRLSAYRAELGAHIAAWTAPAGEGEPPPPAGMAHHVPFGAGASDDGAAWTWQRVARLTGETDGVERLEDRLRFDLQRARSQVLIAVRAVEDLLQTVAPADSAPDDTAALRTVIETLREDAHWSFSEDDVLLREAAMLAKRLDGRMEGLTSAPAPAPYGLGLGAVDRAEWRPADPPGGRSATIVLPVAANWPGACCLLPATIAGFVLGEHALASRGGRDSETERSNSSGELIGPIVVLAAIRDIGDPAFDGPVPALGKRLLELDLAVLGVVDAGLALRRWSRQEAIEFVGAHLPVRPDAAGRLVDAIASDPGRRMAEARLHVLLRTEWLRFERELAGAASPKVFHDLIIEGAGSGGLTGIRARLERHRSRLPIGGSYD